MRQRDAGGGGGSFLVDRRGTILAFDEGMERLTGWPAVDVVGRPGGLGGPTRDRGRAGGPIAGPVYEGAVPVVDAPRGLTLLLRGRDGRRLEAEAVVDPLGGPGERIRVTILRVAACSEAPLSQGARPGRDPRTHLPDAEAFAATLEADFAEASRGARPLALVLADVDRLRELNDRRGRAAGDEVLVRLAGILRVRVADEGRLFHLGDDDFAILLPGAGRGEARGLAATLRSTVERYRFLPDADETAARVTLSLGAASFPADADSAAVLRERAVEALDEARTMGRNRVWCYLRRPRVPVQVPVYFDGSDALLVGYTRDLSPSGVFVQTSTPLDIGMRCALEFPLPGHDGRVHVIGRVVRSVPPDVSAGARPVRVPGIGVEFERFGGTPDRRAIESFLHRNEAATLRPESGLLSLGS